MIVGDRVRVQGESGVWEVRRIFGSLVYVRKGAHAQAVHEGRLRPVETTRRGGG